ncbi:MAG: hypothetical protein KDA65_14870 [Planctomycetaceae bacterium]|nr:hypothetical protein [Planctomycetaceae bacterium]
MAMDLPRSLGFGMLGMLSCAVLMAQEQDLITVSRSESSFRQSNGDIAVPTEQELDAYEAGITPHTSFGNDSDLSAAQALWDTRYEEPDYGLPMAPPVDQKLRPRKDRALNDRALNQQAVEQAAYYDEVEQEFQPRREQPRELPQFHQTADLSAQNIRPLVPVTSEQSQPRAQRHMERTQTEQTTHTRSAYTRRQSAQPATTPSYFHAQNQYAKHQVRAPQQRTQHHQAKSQTAHYQQTQHQPEYQRLLPQSSRGFTPPMVTAGLNPRTIHHQHAGGSYLSQQNQRASDWVQPVQYETMQSRLREPETMFVAEGETFEAPETVMSPQPEAYPMTDYGYYDHGYDNCLQCGSAGCNYDCENPCYFGSNDQYCNCGGCVIRRYRGRHPDSRFKSDYAFADFIEPITNPYWFIDPRSMTRARLVVLSQDIPQNSLTNEGSTTVTSLQGSLAINDRMSFLAAKTGRQTIDIDGQAELDGWLDMALGFKAVLIRDEACRFLLTAGSIYERSNGSRDVYQGNGHGMWHTYLSMGKGWYRQHFLTTVGWHLPNNHDEENESFYYSFHYDYEVFCDKFLVWEINGQHYTESGSRTLNSNIEGGDLFSLGSDNVTGNDFISTAIGGVIRLRDDIHLTAAYEIPISGRHDFMDDRVTATLSYFY